jgi:lysophospholipase L1-like esterase
MNVIIRGAVALMGFCAMIQPAMSESPTRATPARRLVIIGASYAAQWSEPALPGYVVINKGVGGEDSSNVRARFERDVVALKPDVVLIWGHINDIHRAPAGKMDAVTQQTRENYRLMHAAARAAGIEVWLATEVTLSTGGGFLDSIVAAIGRMRGRQSYREIVNREVTAVNAWLREYAAQQKLKLLDFERATQSDNGSRRSDFNQEDGSHINAKGYAALTRYTAERLR